MPPRRPQPRSARRRLLLPNLCLDNAEDVIKNKEMSLPFPSQPNKPGLTDGLTLPKELRLRQLFIFPISIGKKGVTKTAQYVLNMRKEIQLSTVFRSHHLWNNCKTYAHTTTWIDAGKDMVPPLPSDAQQDRAARRLYYWYIDHTLRGSGLTRYENTIDECDHPPEKGDPGKEKSYRNVWGRGSDSTGHPPPEDGHTPHFGRPVSASHVDDDHNKAGFPDFLSQRTPLRLDHGALAEIKSALAVNGTSLRRTLSSSTIRKHGTFPWESSQSKDYNLLRQVWGEMHAYKSNYAFFTNGDEVVLFVRLGRTSLCVSDIKKWDSPDVLEALIGLTFASIDYPSRSWAETAEPTEEMQDSYERSREFVFRHLCPVNELVIDWSSPGRRKRTNVALTDIEKALLEKDAAPAVLPELGPKTPPPEESQGPILIPPGQTRGEGKRPVKPTTRRSFEFNKDSEVTKFGRLRIRTNAPEAGSNSEREGQSKATGSRDTSSPEPQGERSSEDYDPEDEDPEGHHSSSSSDE
ncbi:unnamed protein product [Somion occarium]|uniref:Uncharacterized protein n=1 Tax=Somion occarium TaxID=3059160 RepID=A0ABP1E170_9APHY